jgi:hypothetical protein
MPAAMQDPRQPESFLVPIHVVELDVIQNWRSIAAMEALASDADVARHLLRT